MDPNVVNAAAREGVTALLSLVVFAILVGGWRGWYVWRWVLDERAKLWERLLAEKDNQIKALEEDRDEWRQLAERRADILERSIDIAARSARGPSP